MNYYDEVTKLIDILPELTEISQTHPDAEITAYEGEGGAWVIIEDKATKMFKQYHTRSR